MVVIDAGWWFGTSGWNDSNMVILSTTQWKGVVRNIPTDWYFTNCCSIYLECHHPNWLSYVSRWLKPPSRMFFGDVWWYDYDYWWILVVMVIMEDYGFWMIVDDYGDFGGVTMDYLMGSWLDDDYGLLDDFDNCWMRMRMRMRRMMMMRRRLMRLMMRLRIGIGGIRMMMMMLVVVVVMMFVSTNSLDTIVSCTMDYMFGNNPWLRTNVHGFSGFHS